MIKQWPNNISHIGNYRAQVDIKQKKPLSPTVYMYGIPVVFTISYL